MDLRWYQDGAVEALWKDLKAGKGNPCLVLPTGSGKTPVIATIAKQAIDEYQGRVLVLSHVKEILGQAENALAQWAPHIDTGVYSAGLNRRDLESDCLIAGIQSIHKRAHEVGRRHLVLIDEAHLVSPNAGTMYQKFLGKLAAVNPNLKIAGLTASPYRTTTGRIYGKDCLFSHVAYKAEIKPLIDQGYLCPIINEPTTQVDTSRFSVRAGEFVSGDVADAFDRDSVVLPACRETLAAATDRKSILVFAASVQHGERIRDTFESLGQDAEFISGETLALERGDIISRFKEGKLRILVNCNVLTTGFDATRVDCVAVMRATCSPGLFYQMVGRGFRVDAGKENCLLLDFGENLMRHGALDDSSYGENSWRGAGQGGEAPKKECPSCGDQAPLSTRECECGWLFPENTLPRHEETADKDSKVLLEVRPPEWKTVERIEWFEHIKRASEPDTPRTLRVDYYTEGMSMTDRPYSEWICVEHEGWARQKAESWWSKRCDAPCPTVAADCIEWRERCAVADTRRIKVGSDPKNPKYNRITDYELGDIPSESEWTELASWEDEEVPF